MRSRRLIGIAYGLLASLALAGPAQAAFPGQNGRIAFGEFTEGSPGSADIRSIAADGSDFQEITGPDVYESWGPAWSPDGTKVAFSRNACYPDFGFCDAAEVWVANATGGGEEQLTQGSGGTGSAEPSWSPDGARLAFVRSGSAAPGLYVMNADGSNQTRLTNDTIDASPAWSPDGAKIAYEGRETAPNGNGIDIFVIAAAGGPRQRLTNVAVPDVDPDWSPDGSKIVWAQNHDLWVMNADGSGQTNIVHGSSNLEPAWSPQGNKIVFQRAVCPQGGACAKYDLYTVAPDGSGIAKLFGDDAKDEESPSWQPVPVNSYARPLSARTIRAALVPGHAACDPGQATLQHGPPLAYPSCASPALTSAHLTAGTPDANGRPANSGGQVKATVVGEAPINPGNGDQTDVNYGLQLTDVRERAGLGDYTGELEVRIDLQVTDRDNIPSPFPSGAATGTGTAISFTAPCAATASPDVGATCIASTSADALVPGAVKEGKRAVWELGKVRVFDGGADGDAETGPNTLFAVQGVFIP